VRLLLIVTFILLSCTGKPTANAPAETTRTAEPTQSAEADPSNEPVGATDEFGTDAVSSTTTKPAAAPPEIAREITIDAVEIANPLVVTGHARTFENNVALRVRNAAGKVIAETFTTSTGDAGQRNPYRSTIWLTREPGAKVTVEALEYSARDGSERSLVAMTKRFPVQPIDVKLFVPNANCTSVQPVTRRAPKSVAMARLLVEMLIAEPAPFPKGSRVESAILRDGVLTVDFNERLQNVGGSCAAEMIRTGVTRTLMQLPSVHKVVITAAGNEKLALQP
jgi:hypothetical protein